MMMLWITLKIAVGSLATNIGRSLLTMLGVIIGVGAVIAMLSLGSAFGDYISNQITWLGTNVLFVRAGRQQHGPMGLVQTLRVEDAEALLALPNVKAVSPMCMNSSPLKAGNKASTSAMIAGVAPSLGQIQRIDLDRGRFFTDAEVRRHARVAVLGPKTAADLFGDQDPLDRTVRIHGLNFRVIGLTRAVGDQGGFNPDDRVLMPFTTCMTQLPPRREFIEMIAVGATDRAAMGALTEDIRAVLRRHHRLRPDEGDDFAVQNLTEILETFQKVSLGLTFFLGTVAAISLVVGGIGIMNIMLATVAERTREVGVRKALGAKDRDILRQFLIETMVLTLGGGLLGLALGWGLMALVGSIVGQWMNLAITMQWWVVAVSIAVSLAVGLVSGLYPCWRASRLDPITALGYE